MSDPKPKGSPSIEEKPTLFSQKPVPHSELDPPEDCGQRKITIGKTLNQSPDGSLIEYDCAGHDDIAPGQWQLQSQEKINDHQTCFTYRTCGGFVKEYRAEEGDIFAQEFLDRDGELREGFEGWAEKSWWANGRLRKRSSVFPCESDEEWQALTKYAREGGGALRISEFFSQDGAKAAERIFLVDEGDGQLYKCYVDYSDEREMEHFESQDRHGVVCSSENTLTYFDSDGGDSWVKAYKINKDGESVYHRTDGPAIFDRGAPEGWRERYFIEGTEYTKAEWEERLASKDEKSTNEPAEETPNTPDVPESCERGNIIVGEVKSSVQSDEGGKVTIYECPEREDIASGDWWLEKEETREPWGTSSITYRTREGVVKESYDRDGRLTKQVFKDAGGKFPQDPSRWVEKQWWDNGKLSAREKNLTLKTEEDFTSLRQAVEESGGSLLVSEHFKENGELGDTVRYVIQDGLLRRYMENSFVKGRGAITRLVGCVEGDYSTPENTPSFLWYEYGKIKSAQYETMRNGEYVLHRTDGPALIDRVEPEDRQERYFLEGVEYTKAEWAKKTGRS